MLLATELDDDDAIGFLLDRASSFAETRSAVVAAACAHKRSGKPDADALARLIGLG